MVKIKQQLVPQAKRYATFGAGNPKKKLVVHQTGNRRRGANAQMHANLQSRGWRNASWHIQSDDKEIIQSWPFTYRLWHASTGRASSGGNMAGIGWEICVNSDGDYLKSLEVAAEGIAQVMKQEGIPMSGLTTHNAEDPQNKWCPAQILSGWHGITWPKFKEMVRKAYDGKAVMTNGKPTPKPKKSNEEVAREVLNGKWGNNPKRRNDLIAAGYDYNTIQSIVNHLAGGSKPKPVSKSIDQLAREVIDGKFGSGEARKKALGDQYSAVQERVNEILGAKPKATPKPPKSIETLAREVIDGKHGTGDVRKKSLGSQYQAVQNRVNQILGAGGTSKKSVDTIAREVIAGKWGNDPERSRRLRQAGYDPVAVQRRVNQLL